MSTASVALYKFCQTCEKAEEEIVTCGGKTVEKADKLVRCGVCRLTYYCSKTCQKADWPAHKKVCRKSNIEFEGKKMEATLKAHFAAHFSDTYSGPTAAEQNYLQVQLRTKPQTIRLCVNGTPIQQYQNPVGMLSEKKEHYICLTSDSTTTPREEKKREKRQKERSPLMKKHQKNLHALKKSTKGKLIVSITSKRQEAEITPSGGEEWIEPIGNTLFMVGTQKV